MGNLDRLETMALDQSDALLGRGPEEFLFGFGAMLEQLSPHADPDAVPRFEQAMCELGLHLGFSAQRPEREIGLGPDVLWGLGDMTYLVIECKSGSEAGRIPRSDMAQLSQSMDWFGEAYSSCEATPVLVHPSRKLHSKATAGSGCRILTFDKLEKLRGAISTFSTSIAHGSGYADPATVEKRLAALHLNAPALADHWTVKTTR